MIPERSKLILERFGAVTAPESQIFSKSSPATFFCRKIICWESFEMDFGEVSAALELISGGFKIFADQFFLGRKIIWGESFEVWRTYVCT